MKKVLMFICLLLLAVPFVAMGQGTTTMTIGSVEAPAAGLAVSVPVTVENFSSVGSITLKIAYDPAVATFVGIANAPAGFSATANAASGVISVIMYDATGNTPVTIASGGKLADLNFTYIAGSTNITFNAAQCEVTNSTGGAINASYVNGSITSSTNIKMTIGSVTASAPGAISVPITVKNFTSVGSVTLKIAYDPAVATYVGVANAPAGVNFTANAAGGVITLIWYDATGNTPITIASGGKLVDLNFTYIAGTSAVTFSTAQCEVTNSTGGAISGINYVNGNIATTPKALTIGAVTASKAGDTVKVPITVGNFSSVGSITLKIAYDPAVVTFVGVANAPTGVNFVANAASGVITVIWYDASGNTPISIADGGKLVDLKFTYIAGTSAVTFNTAQCEVTNATGGAITGTTYNNGSITYVQNLKPIMTPISAVTKTALDTVTFVVNATDANVGDVLTYSASNLPTGAKFTAATRTFLWVPAASQVGTFSPRFIVTDGQLKDSITVSITIRKKGLAIKAPMANLVLDDNNRTVYIRLSSVFIYNMGPLTFTATSGNSNYILASIIAPDRLMIQGIRTTPVDVNIRITVTATDTDKSVLSTSFLVRDEGTTGVNDVPIVPTEFSLSQNYPNPFNPSTAIKFGLPSQAPVTMEIYNMLGVKVRTLIQGKVMSAGIHQMEWNGKDDAGVSVTSGVYLYRINAGTFQVTKKMMMLK